MIYEVRTYTLTVGSVAEFEDNFAKALHHREKYSKLTGCWHTEFGPLNQVVHIWAYDDLKHRTEVREAVAKDPNWPPDDNHMLIDMESEIVIPAPFMEPIKPGHYGNIYEMRYYQCKPGSMPEIMRLWAEKMPKRVEYTPLFLCGYTEIGQLQKLIHIWPYEDMAHRMRVREETVKKGDWPPKTREFVVNMKNKLLIPSHFSPVH